MYHAKKRSGQEHRPEEDRFTLMCMRKVHYYYRVFVVVFLPMTRLGSVPAQGLLRPKRAA